MSWPYAYMLPSSTEKDTNVRYNNDTSRQYCCVSDLDRDRAKGNDFLTGFKLLIYSP